MQQSTPYLSFRGITMTFPGVKALSDISFDCYPGQIHALMGENGAGKSTLLKILSGNYIPTAGHLQIGGQQMAFSNTMEALNAGVAIIYQELHLIPEMTVAENIYLGQLPHRGGIVNRSLLNYEARLQLEHLGLDIDPETPLKYLSIGQWQMVEIAKALARNAKIIAFDEPTSSLSAREIDNLFRVTANCGRRGESSSMFRTGWKKFLPSAMPSPSLRMAAVSALLTICRASVMTPWFRRWWGAIWAIYTAGNLAPMAKSGCVWRRSKHRACVRRSASRYAVAKSSACSGWWAPGAAD